VFSVVYAVILKPLPYFEPERLVKLSEANPQDASDTGEVAAGTFVDWRARTHTLEALAMYTVPLAGETVWTIGDRPVVVKAASVSPALFSVLRVQPVLGRVFPSEPDPNPPPAGQFVISYGLWQRAFGGSNDVVGRRVMIEGRLPREIIGVLPRGFAFPEGTDAWIAAPLSTVAEGARRSRSGFVVARLAPGMTVEDARKELDGISAQLASAHPASNAGWVPRVEPLAGADARRAHVALMALLGAVAGVLLIGCANVANLLLARAVARRRELAVRLALGATIPRLVRAALAEAAVLAGAGVLVGLVFGDWLARALVRLAPPDIPRLDAVRTGGPVFVFAALIATVAALLTGVLPAFHTIRAESHGGPRTDTRTATDRTTTVRRFLVAAEVAVVVLLLTTALLLVRTFVHLRGVNLGFATEHVTEVETRWPIGTLFGAPGQQWPRVQRAVSGLLDSVAAVPGVDAVGAVAEVPLSGDPLEAAVWRADAAGAHGDEPPTAPRDRWKTDIEIVSPGYFGALQIPIVRGRGFNAADRFSDDQLTHRGMPRSGVAIVNASFASRFFSGEDPVGRDIVIPAAGAFAAVRTIVGIAGDVHGRSIAESPQPAVFIPLAQNPDVFRPSLLVRSALPYSAISEAVQRRLADSDPALLVLRIRPMTDLVSGTLARPRFNLVLLSAFAIVGLSLSAVGIYGVLAYLVTERTREIGIRMALGAQSADVLTLLMREGLMPVAFGSAVGVAASVFAARAIRSLLFGVTPVDPVSLGGAPLLLAVVALLAWYIPARRALAVDPIVALRDE
jgi:putative ABC transport system permease protein